LGNIPARTNIRVEISYVNELKADLGGEGVLVTIPTSVAPRYGSPVESLRQYADKNMSSDVLKKGLRIIVNVDLFVPIRKLESCTHPISVEVGSSQAPVDARSFADLTAPPDYLGFDPKKACATLSDRAATLGKDFNLLILASGASLLASCWNATKQGYSGVMSNLLIARTDR